MEPVETEESNTDKSIQLITEIKHPTDRRDHTTMTLKINEQERTYHENRITGYNITTGKRLDKKQENITDNKKLSGCQ